MTINNNKQKWEAIIVTITLLFCVIGLAGLSYISFFQTLFAFKPLNDPTMIVGGVAVGNWVAFLCALLFQYGQNAALYIRKVYGTDKIAFNVMGFFNVRNSDTYLIVFAVCAIIDAGTNIIWLSSQPEVANQAFYFKVIEYSVMALLVFVEEVLGITLQALSHSIEKLKEINGIVTKKSPPYNLQPSTYKPPTSNNRPINSQNNQRPQNKPFIASSQQSKNTNDYFAQIEKKRRQLQQNQMPSNEDEIPDFFKEMN